MRILYNWLKDYVDLKTPPEKLAELLTMSGLSVESVEKMGNDHILEIEVTSNRADCLSVIGVAREVAAITGRRLKVPKVKGLKPRQSDLKVDIKIEDKKLCPRYTGRVIADIKAGESPAWLKSKIEKMGLRSVNNIVDITNFCLFETGEPMHAFDLDKIPGGEVIVRRARKGEKIVTIDGIERTLNDATLVIADRLKPIAIAGVMGGLDTEVSGTTKNVLLEAALFDPVSIRRTSRRLGLSTESSYRFERRVDAENIIWSSDRASSLIREEASGIPGRIFEIGTSHEKPRAISLRYSRSNKVLGLDIAPAKVNKILTSLGLKVKSRGAGRAHLTIPAFRNDLQDEIDLIEEVARIQGYDKIPLTIPAVVEQPLVEAREKAVMIANKKIRTVLTGIGFDEIITYSLVKRGLLNMAGITDKSCVEIENPLSAEQEVMRSSLVPGMLNVMLWNANRKIRDLKLFELGNIYTAAPGGAREKRSLAIGMTGQAYSSWSDKPRMVQFADLMGALEAVLSEFGIGAMSYTMKEAKDEKFSASACAAIGVGDRTIGMAGLVSSNIQKNFDMQNPVYILELDIDSLIDHIVMEKKFKDIPKYPSVSRDISIIVGKEVPNRDMVSLMKNRGGNILKDILLIDRYSGKQIPDGKIGLTYHLEYQDMAKTLEEKEVSEAHSRIITALEEKFGARLR